MSTLNVSNITDGTTTVGTSYVVNGSAKAWVSINHNSGTPSIQSGSSGVAGSSNSTRYLDCTGFKRDLASARRSQRWLMLGLLHKDQTMVVLC